MTQATIPRRLMALRLGSSGAECDQPACTAPCFPQISVSPEIEAVVGDIITLASLKQVAARVPEGLRCEMEQDIERSLHKVIDDYCGTPSDRWLGPQADVVSLVGALAVTAQSFPNEAMRDEVIRVAASIVQKTALPSRKG